MKPQDNREQEHKKSNLTDNNPAKAMDNKRDEKQSSGANSDQEFPGYPHYDPKEDIMDRRTETRRVDINVEDLANARNKPGVGQRLTSDNSQEDRGGRTSPQQGVEDDFSDINPRTEITKGSRQATDEPISEIGIARNPDINDTDVEIPGTGFKEVSTEADVTPEERMALENMYMPTGDEENLSRSKLDSTDFDGDELNEGSFGEVLSSAELDIPEETDETFDTAMGQGDEENKYYSLGGDRQENNREDPYSGPNRGNDA